MTKASPHKWEFRTRFRRHAFGWKSQPAIKRIKEAVSEIKKVARKDKLLAAEGAVLFLEKVSPALEHVDSSSGSIGAAVSNAITALVDIVATAPADEAPDIAIRRVRSVRHFCAANWRKKLRCFTARTSLLSLALSPFVAMLRARGGNGWAMPVGSCQRKWLWG